MSDPFPAPKAPDPGLASHDRLYRTLRQQVMHGELPPGQALTLRGLAAQFGMSMTPAREAVRRLAAEGALTISASGRVTTTGFRELSGGAGVTRASASRYADPRGRGGGKRGSSAMPRI